MAGRDKGHLWALAGGRLQQQATGALAGGPEQGAAGQGWLPGLSIELRREAPSNQESALGRLVCAS